MHFPGEDFASGIMQDEGGEDISVPHFPELAISSLVHPPDLPSVLLLDLTLVLKPLFLPLFKPLGSFAMRELLCF